MNDIHDILMKASLSVQQVNKYPPKYDNRIQYLQQRLTKYSEVPERLNTDSIKDMENLQASVLYSIVVSMYFCFILI